MERSSFLSNILRTSSSSGDMVVVVLLITAIGAMILPVTPIIADFLIALNMGIGVLLLMVAFYIRSPVDFSSLPSVILISTVFRLSISIAATRLILLEGEGGQIIQTFGDFVIAGNVMVGLVVFLIITIVQFVVITKGSERVAEVAARFSLDGLPGKQMSIDSDMRNGDIDQAEARRRRQFLERESQLYGAMDGAMKFVKGDAIAGLIIIAVNLFGGIAIGMMQRGLSFKDSTQIYSLLTIGEGLIAQIPALFISLTAGTIVTRVTAGTNQNLGADIVAQIVSRPEAIRLSALIMVGLAIVPGFPTAVFLTLGGIAGVGGTLLLRRERTLTAPVSAVATRVMSAEVSTLLPAPVGAPITLVVSPSLFEAFQRESITMRLRSISDAVAHDAGFAIPGIGYRIDAKLPTSRYMVELDMVPEVIRDLSAGRRYVRKTSTRRLDDLRIEYQPVLPKAAPHFVSVDEAKRTQLEDLSIKVLTDAQLAENDVTYVLHQNASHFVGVQETRRLLSSLEGEYKDLIREAQRVAPIQRMADVLKRLLQEGVSIRNMRLILEAILEHAPRETDTQALTNQVRATLKRQLCYQQADDDKVLRAFIVERGLEDFLRKTAQPNAKNELVVDAETAANFLTTLQKCAGSFTETDLERAIVLVAPDLRRLVWSICATGDPRYAVFSYNEISPEYLIRTLATIGVNGGVSINAKQDALSSGAHDRQLR